MINGTVVGPAVWAMTRLRCETDMASPEALRAIGTLVDFYGQREAIRQTENTFGVDSVQATAVREYDFFND